MRSAVCVDVYYILAYYVINTRHRSLSKPTRPARRGTAVALRVIRVRCVFFRQITAIV